MVRVGSHMVQVGSPMVRVESHMVRVEGCAVDRGLLVTQIPTDAVGQRAVLALSRGAGSMLALLLCWPCCYVGLAALEEWLLVKSLMVRMRGPLRRAIEALSAAEGFAALDAPIRHDADDGCVNTLPACRMWAGCSRSTMELIAKSRRWVCAWEMRYQRRLWWPVVWMQWEWRTVSRRRRRASSLLCVQVGQHANAHVMD